MIYIFRMIHISNDVGQFGQFAQNVGQFVQCWTIYTMLHNSYDVTICTMLQDQDNVFGDADLEPYCKFCFAKRWSFIIYGAGEIRQFDLHCTVKTWFEVVKFDKSLLDDFENGSNGEGC